VKTYFDCWMSVAAALFSQALAGEPQLAETAHEPLGEPCFGFAATLAGDVEGRFIVMVDGAILDAPLLGEGVEQKTGWRELLREAADAAAGELLAKSGKNCQVLSFEECMEEGQATHAPHAFELRSGDRRWAIHVSDEVRVAAAAEPVKEADEPGETAPAPLAPGLELLLDVELEASLRFGSREMPLGDILDLGPGDVVELDRHVADPVDLIVGDKIVGRGEVVLVNGNFALRVTEVAAPKKRLESIRCLF
jgi:flagellar motor switch protein FliN